MASQPLDITILRKGRKMGELHATADPANPAELTAILEQWLSGNKWGTSLWAEFSLDAREAGRWKIAATVRATP